MQKAGADIPEQELSPQERALIDKVSRFVLSLDKNTKALKFYLPNNPSLIKHQNDLFDLVKEYFAHEKELVLKATNSSFIFMGQPVYHNTEKTDNFAFKLYSDGIRSITFSEGLNKEELLEFMRILNKGIELQAQNSDEDLVTLLWDKQFDNIKYQVAESVIEASQIEEAGKSNEERIEDIIHEDKGQYYGFGEDYKEIIDMEEIPLAFDATNFGEMFKIKGVLSKEELEKVRQEIDYNDRKENVLADFMDILPCICQEEIREEEIRRILVIIQGIVDSCVFSGNLATASAVMQKLSRFPELLKSTGIPIEKDIENFKASISKREKIEEFLNCLTLSFSGTVEEISGYISNMTEEAVPILLKSLPKIPDSHYRKAVCLGIATMFKGDPTVFLKIINTKDPESLHDLIFLLSNLKNEKVVDLIPHFISHSDKSIKKESIALLKNFKSSSKAIKILTNTLGDADVEIRTLTLRILAVSESRDVAKNLLARISTEEFSKKDLQEKKSYFFAISKISQNDFIPRLSDILEMKKWYSKESLDEFYQCACFALGIIASDRAKEILERGIASNNKAVQKYCHSILKKIEMGA